MDWASVAVRNNARKYRRGFGAEFFGEFGGIDFLVVVHIADAKHVVEADYFGVVSGKTEKDKFAKSGMTYTKSELVDAPIINEFPIALECEFIEYQSDETGLGVIGKVLRTSVEEANMKDGKVDIDSLEAIAFDPYTHGYYKVNGRVGDAFKDGLKLK